MSKIVRRLNREDRHERLMNSGMSKRELARMVAKHMRWPLCTDVECTTSIGTLYGVVVKHWRNNEYPHSCSVDFLSPTDLGDANGERYCHNIPFRNMRKVPG